MRCTASNANSSSGVLCSNSATDRLFSSQNARNGHEEELAPNSADGGCSCDGRHAPGCSPPNTGINCPAHARLIIVACSCRGNHLSFQQTPRQQHMERPEASGRPVAPSIKLPHLPRPPDRMPLGDGSHSSNEATRLDVHSHPRPRPSWRRLLAILALLLTPFLASASEKRTSPSSDLYSSTTSSPASTISITGTQLRLELDLRQLHQAVASTGFVGDPSTTTSPFLSSSASTTSQSAGDAIPLPSYELPGTPAELTACINTHQPDIKGTTWTDAMRDQPTYFKVVGMWWSRKRADVPVTITTQLSWNRKWQLKAMCRSWAGPIAAVMHMPVLLPRLTRSRDAALGDVSNATLQRAVNTVAAFHARLDASQPCKLDLMLLAEPYREGKSLVLYPVNTLRNYARLMARTPIIGLVDVDLIVSSSLRSELLNATAAATYVTEATTAAAAAAAGEAAPLFATGDSRLDGVPAALATQLNLSLATIGLEGRHGRRQRAAWILPAFETRSGSVTLQVERAEKLAAAGNKSRLLPYFQHGKVLRFDWGSTGHKNTDYSKWFNTTEPYVVEWSGRYEPWVVVDRLSSSWADARFRGYGKNKIIHIRTLAYEGYELRVHPFAFLIHRPHLESSSAFAHARGALNGKKSKASSMYGHNVNLYKSIEVSMAYGNYTPVVDPATAACRATLSWWRRQASGGVR